MKNIFYRIFKKTKSNFADAMASNPDKEMNELKKRIDHVKRLHASGLLTKDATSYIICEFLMNHYKLDKYNT